MATGACPNGWDKHLYVGTRWQQQPTTTERGRDMPLNFDFGDTEFFKTEGTICNSEPAADGRHYHLPEIEYIIWGSMFVGIGHITSANVDKFIARCRLYEAVHDPFVKKFSFVTETWVSAFDETIIRRCVGYRANVTPKTKSQFIASLTRGMNL